MGQFETQVSTNGMKRAAASGEALKLKRKGKDVGVINILKAEVSGVEDVTQRMAAIKRLSIGACEMERKLSCRIQSLD